MKKIFNILMIAAVALGAVACDNAIDDNLTPEQQGESVSITVSIAETRVALGEAVDGQLPLKFEEGDELYVVNGWADSTEEGYYFTYTKQEGGNYVFTCTAEGVSGIVGDWKGIYYLGGRKQAIGAYGDTASESINGVFMNGAGSIGGSAPIELTVAPVLKLKSDYAVTISASDWIFCNGTKTYTTQKTGEWIYLAVNTDGTFEISASVLGEVVKTKTFTLKDNTIYNLGEIKPVEKEKDNANITINGNFEDWVDVTNCVATLPDGVSYTAATLIKGYADADYLYVYLEYDPTNVNKMSMFIDPDYSNTTGCTGNWGQNGSSLLLEDGDVSVDTEWGPSANSYTGTDGADEWKWAWFWNGQIVYTHVPVVLEEGKPAVGMEIKLDKQYMNLTLGEKVGVGVLMQNGGDKVGRLPASASGSSAAYMLLIEVPAAE